MFEDYRDGSTYLKMTLSDCLIQSHLKLGQIHDWRRNEAHNLFVNIKSEA